MVEEIVRDRKPQGILATELEPAMLEAIVLLGIFAAIVEAMVRINVWEDWEGELPENQDMEPHDW